MLFVCLCCQSAFTAGHVQSACCKRLYLLYRFFGKVKEPTEGAPLILLWPSTKCLFHCWSVRWRSAFDLYRVSYSAARQHKIRLAQFHEIRCPSLKWLEFRNCTLLFVSVNGVKCSCWHWEELKAPKSAVIIDTIWEELAVYLNLMSCRRSEKASILFEHDRYGHLVYLEISSNSLII